MAQPLLKIEGKIDPEKEFPHIASFSDLTRDIQAREALFLETQEAILQVATNEPDNKKILQKLEAEAGNEAQRTLQLCKAINQRVWVNGGISDEQHEKAGERAQKIFKEFKETAEGLRRTREQKKKDNKFNLLEFNAALLLAPLAAYGIMKVHFPEAENDALCKNVSVVVAGVEIVYVFRKNATDAWCASVKEITKRKDKKPLSLFHSKEAWAEMGAKIKTSINDAVKNLSTWAEKKASVRAINRLKQKLIKKKDF